MAEQETTSNGTGYPVPWDFNQTLGPIPLHAKTLPQDHDRTTVRKKVLASCTSCRRRKIKCDRANPCSNCTRTGATCVSSAPSRAPRGRQGGRRKVDSELLGRIAKLENLVKDIETGYVETPVAASPINENQQLFQVTSSRQNSKAESRSSTTASSTKDGLDRYLGSSLWMTLSGEINGMREVLDQSSDEEDEDTSTQSPDSQGHANHHYDLGIGGPNNLPLDTGALQQPALPQIHELYAVYASNVDRAVKILHIPSLRQYLLEGSGQLSCSPGSRGLEALKFAIYYAATTSLTPEDCLCQLGEDKAVLLHRYRRGVGAALARADFVNTEDMSTLQALVIFLLCVRCNDNTRLSWTLTALAVRIGQALGLHRDNFHASLSPFLREMRRRLWWQILVLDLQASNDRGSDPVIALNSFNTKLPLNVNDEDLNPEDTTEAVERDEFTDMTFSLVCREIFRTVRELNYVPVSEFSRPTHDIDDHWRQRRDMVIACRRRIEEKYLRHCTTEQTYHRGTRMIADVITASMWLQTYRPLQRREESTESFRIPYPGILHLSLEVLEKAHEINNDPTCDPFRWLSRIYVQWHPLAVMIAELCVQTEGPIVERAWNVVEAMYQETANTVADSDKGMLFRPIKKMYEKAKRVRKNRHGILTEPALTAPCAPDPARENGLPADVGQPFQDVDQYRFDPYKVDLAEHAPRPMAGIHQESSSLDMGTTQGFNWDPWLVGNGSNQGVQDTEMNQMARANWENFIDDFQGGEIFNVW